MRTVAPSWQDLKADLFGDMRSSMPALQAALLHGLRTAAAVSIALGLAFWLQLDE